MAATKTTLNKFKVNYMLSTCDTAACNKGKQVETPPRHFAPHTHCR